MHTHLRTQHAHTTNTSNRYIKYELSLSVSLAALEVVVDFGALLTTHVYTPVLLSWTLLMVRVLVVVPDTPTEEGSKLAQFRCHWYVSVPTSVLAATVNVNSDPGTTFSWFVGC